MSAVQTGTNNPDLRQLSTGKGRRTNRKAPTDKPFPRTLSHPPTTRKRNNDHLRPTRSLSRRLRPFLQNPLQLAQARLPLVREFGRVQKDGIEIR